jgi:hypothetical protein
MLSASGTSPLDPTGATPQTPLKACARHVTLHYQFLDPPLLIRETSSTVRKFPHFSIPFLSAYIGPSRLGQLRHVPWLEGLVPQQINLAEGNASLKKCPGKNSGALAAHISWRRRWFPACWSFPKPTTMPSYGLSADDGHEICRYAAIALKLHEGRLFTYVIKLLVSDEFEVGSKLWSLWSSKTWWGKAKTRPRTVLRSPSYLTMPLTILSK